MSAVSADNPKFWKTKPECPAALEIILLQRTYVLPWVQFLYAEGDADEIHIAFATHDVLVKGAGLDALLEDLALHRIAQLHQPARTDQFEDRGASCIRRSAYRKSRTGINNDERILRKDTIPKPAA